jgi:hypothetical protein
LASSNLRTRAITASAARISLPGDLPGTGRARGGAGDDADPDRREGLGPLGSGALLLAAIAASSGLWIVGAVAFSVRAATPRALGAE